MYTYVKSHVVRPPYIVFICQLYLTKVEGERISENNKSMRV